MVIFNFIHLKFGDSDLFQISGFGFRVLWLSLAAFILLLQTPDSVLAATKGKSVKEGNKLYQEQKYDEALGKYMEAFEKDPNSDVINFDLGTALYKKNNYDEAVSYFEKSLLTEDEKLKEKTHYNLGNSFYKSGIKKEEKDLHAAVDSLKQSLSEYEKALVLNKENQDVIFNYDFVKKELERIEKKQKEQQQNKKDEKQDSDKSDQQKDQADQQENKEDQKEEQSQSEKDQQQEKQQSQQNEEKSKESKQAEKDQSQGEQKQQEMKEAKEMSKEEAEMLLEGYKQDEEPRELLNFMGRKRSEQPVLKDW